MRFKGRNVWLLSETLKQSKQRAWPPHSETPLPIRELTPWIRQILIPIGFHLSLSKIMPSLFRKTQKIQPTLLKSRALNTKALWKQTNSLSKTGKNSTKTCISQTWTLAEMRTRQKTTQQGTLLRMLPDQWWQLRWWKTSTRSSMLFKSALSRQLYTWTRIRSLVLSWLTTLSVLKSRCSKVILPVSRALHLKFETMIKC